MRATVEETTVKQYEENKAYPPFIKATDAFMPVKNPHSHLIQQQSLCMSTECSNTVKYKEYQIFNTVLNSFYVQPTFKEKN